MNKRRMNILSRMGFFTFLCMLFLTSCSAPPAVSPDFNEEEVKQAAENVVTLLNAQDSEGLRELFTEQMKAAITDDVFIQIYAALEGGGNFEAIESINLAGSTDKSTGEEFATAAVKAKYESKSFIYTISFNKQMQVAGLFYR